MKRVLCVFMCYVGTVFSSLVFSVLCMFVLFSGKFSLRFVCCMSYVVKYRSMLKCYVLFLMCVYIVVCLCVCCV